MEHRRWALPRPVAFVLSGGASLGAVQVGMLAALAEAGVAPDLVVGTSVGALNGAVLAETGDVAATVERLTTSWQRLAREDVFPGGLPNQALRLARHGSLYPPDGLATLIRSSLRVRRFEQLALPFGLVATDVLTGHARYIDSGPLGPALLATSAIPGLFPPVEVDGALLEDGGMVANVPLVQAVERGAASLVVLDAGDVCHLDVPPRPVPDGVVHALATAVRQRVLLEAPLVARSRPTLYLPRPCIRNRSPLDLTTSAELIEPARACAARFLATATPRGGPELVGAPHHHEDGPFRPLAFAGL